MNRQRRPQAKLSLRHVQHCSDYGKRQQGDRVQHEDRSERDGDLFLGRIGDWGDSGDGAAATDGRAGRDEIRDSLLYHQQPSQSPTQEQG